MFSQWYKLSVEMMEAQFEAQRVIGLRLAVIAAGGTDAAEEMQQMVTEKLAANANASVALAAGKSPRTVLRRYRTIMRANERRLSKGR
jgi:hypothetical protein